MNGAATFGAPVASAGLRSRTTYQSVGQVFSTVKCLSGRSSGGQCEASDRSEQLCDILMDGSRSVVCSFRIR